MASYYDLISENDESTVVAQFENSYMVGERPYMSEKNLEDQFVALLQEQQYEYVCLTTEAELIGNLRKQIEKLNKVSFNDSEWKRFFTTNIAKPNAGVIEKTRIIQEDPRFNFTFDNGDMKNIMLLDKTHIHENNLQVIRQYRSPSPSGESRGGTRYDVTILVNGLPLVHVEQKKPGVDIREAFNQIKRYNRDSFWADNGLFEFTQIYVISNGTYTIINAIQDKNVLPFHLEYIRTMREKDGIEDEEVSDIDRERITRDPKYISNIVTYIIRNFGKKTKRNSTYQVKDQRLHGFNSIFATASIDAAKLYYKEFKRQMQYVPADKRLKVAMIYSYGANAEDAMDGELYDENPDDTSTLSQTDKEALQECINDYNKEFGCNFDLSSNGFQSFYKDVSKKRKNSRRSLTKSV